MTFKDDMQRISKVVAKSKAEVFFEHVAKDKIRESAQEGLTKTEIQPDNKCFSKTMNSPYFLSYLKELSDMHVEVEKFNIMTEYLGEVSVGVTITFDWSED